MAIIHVKVATGDEFTISSSFYGRSGPLKDSSSAQVQLGFLFTEMASVGTDQGKTINASHVVYGWVEE